MATQLRSLAGAVAGLLLASACATAVEGGSGSTSAPRVTTSPAAAGQAAPAAGPITISFAGDVHFEGGLRSLLSDPKRALEPIAAVLSASDLTVVNLETSVGSGGTREAKRFTFQAPPAALAALGAAGVDVVTMANNHAGDFGFAALLEGLSAARRTTGAGSGPAVVGVGHDADSAFAAAVRDVRGTTVAVLGASAADADPTADRTGHWAAQPGQPGMAMAVEPARLVEAVRVAREQADVVVVYLHWGVQGELCPSADQRELASVLAAAGADVVVGSHAHRLQGAGLLGDTYVAFGLGNFVWYTSRGYSATTGVLTLEIEGGKVTSEQWSPATIDSSGLPSFSSGAAAARERDSFWQLRACAGLDPVADP